MGKIMSIFLFACALFILFPLRVLGLNLSLVGREKAYLYIYIYLFIYYQNQNALLWGFPNNTLIIEGSNSLYSVLWYLRLRSK